MANVTKGLRQVHINTSIETDKILDKFKAQGQTYTESIRHALILYSYLEEVEATGQRIFVHHPNGNFHELRVI